MTEPLTTLEHDVSGMDGFMLDTDKLMASELWALSSGEEFKAAIGLWCRAWKQKPAGSLPNDPKVLAAFSGAGPRWSKVKDVALRGFILCSDGRLYHKTLCEDVHRAAASKALRQERTRAATEARKSKRDVKRDDNTDDERDVPQNPNVTKSHSIAEHSIAEHGRDKAGLGSARDNSVILEQKLREAAGWEREPHPKLCVTGPIEALLTNGADLELDVLAVVRSLSPGVRKRTSWNYFIDAIAEARDRRIAASTLVSTPQPGRKSNGYDTSNSNRKGTAELIFETLPRGHGEGAEDVWKPGDGDGPYAPDKPH